MGVKTDSKQANKPVILGLDEDSAEEEKSRMISYCN